MAHPSEHNGWAHVTPQQHCTTLFRSFTDPTKGDQLVLVHVLKGLQVLLQHGAGVGGACRPRRCSSIATKPRSTLVS